MKAQSKVPKTSRQDRLIQERVHDPYKARRKLSEPTMCPSCHAVYHDGRWQWREKLPSDGDRELCEACRRIQDGCPAGLITLSGDYLRHHKAEILNLINNEQRKENAEHPLHRIMRIDERAETVVISTTDIHLPRRLGDAVHHACKGNLDVHYDEGGCLLRIHWNRHD